MLLIDIIYDYLFCKNNKINKIQTNKTNNYYKKIICYNCKIIITKDVYFGQDKHFCSEDCRHRIIKYI
jgi:hypothetical protein